jgi:hypothetical protein
MAHYAFLDSNNIVTEVITGKDEGTELTDWEQWYGEFRGQVCKRTSYNTYGGVHRNGGTPFRKNYAGIGYTYDAERDAFIPPKPYASWVLNETTCLWGAPTPEPVEEGKLFRWDEPTTSWVEVIIVTRPPAPKFRWDEITSSWVEVTNV